MVVLGRELMPVDCSRQKWLPCGHGLTQPNLEYGCRNVFVCVHNFGEISVFCCRVMRRDGGVRVMVRRRVIVSWLLSVISHRWILPVCSLHTIHTCISLSVGYSLCEFISLIFVSMVSDARNIFCSFLRTNNSLQDLKSMNLSLNEVVDVVQNRSIWRLMSMFGATHS